ncbi:MAG: DUF3291 domain-containing protein [Flavobacteriales bacterium]|nr:MAG: DUF3291 domain-containing protein [Flavobacteriales bacterium]
MNSISTLTLFRFTNLRTKVWAFSQMQFAHTEMVTIKGLQFYKLMGSGRDLGFSPFPDWGVYAMLGVWDDEQSAEDFFEKASIFSQYKANSAEHWTVFMKPINTKGLWSGKNPFVQSTDIDQNNGLIAVITRATIKPSKLLAFWRYVPTSQRPIQKGCPGLIYTKGIGEAPLVQMATFSIWESLEALKNFAYNSPEHKEAIKRTHQIDWYKEEMFARFQPYKSTGAWGGSNPLNKYLQPA